MRVADTNIIARLVLQDDAVHAAAAERVLLNEKLLIPCTVLLEVFWVVQAVRGQAAGKAAAQRLALADLTTLLGTGCFEVEDLPATLLALDWARQGLDFADALHLARAQGSQGLLSFDAGFAKRSAKLRPATACPVSVPG